MNDYSELQEPVIGQDEFRKPKVLTGWDALLQTILVVLFGRPGCFPSIPELGMNIQKYRYVQENNLDVEGLKTEFAKQCGLISTAIDASEIDIKTTRSANGDLMLVFVIPMEDTEMASPNMLLGVQMAEDGIHYNYQMISAT